MPIQPRDFLTVAEELHASHQHSKSEPHLRTALGRSYYAAYLAIRDVLRQKHHDLTFDVRHQDLCRDLKTCGDPDWREIGNSLDLLRGQREHSDYQPHTATNVVMVSVLLGVSRAILDAIPAIAVRVPTTVTRRRR